MPAKTFALAAGLLLVYALPAAADDAALAAKAHAVLKASCHRCHGQDGSVEGAMNFVLDLGKLADRKKVVAGNAAGSRLFRRMADGSMPPPDEHPRPSAADLAAVREWIDAGAPGAIAVTPRKPITAADVQALILADLDRFDRRARRFQRYFSLAHLHNAGVSADELQTYRNALSKLVNSLSWHPTVRAPEAIDPAKAVLRVDLRWYLWDAATWNRVLNDYPYGVLDDGAASRAVVAATAARLPVVRADWFVAAASRAPLYYDVLQIPTSLGELEKQLRIDANANVQQERVVRVGFNGSGVSRFNRVLERHDGVNGMYWRTYDFDEPPANLAERAGGPLPPDRRNVFAFPLGPANADAPFQHAGGEAIFALPNGLHAFVVVKADNTRIDKAPVAIVSDPRRPDRAVEPGVSCMGCHVTGINPKADQIRDHLDKNPHAFSRGDAEKIRALYPPKEVSLAAMEADARRYAEAVAKTGAKVSRTEAVNAITTRYEADVDLVAAASEVGLTPDEFRKRVSESPALVQNVGALRAAGGTLTRAVWVGAFGDVARELRLGSLYQANLNGPTAADNAGEADPLETRDGTANGVALAPDGRRALIAAGDRSVRLRDVEGRRDVKLFVGHTASVWAVAFNTDGSKAASGGMDATARVWDVASGQERVRFDAHAGLVSAVAFTPDGRRVVSGGFDGLLAVWDAGTGKELARAEKLGFVTSLAVDPAGTFALVGTGTGLLAVDLADGRITRRFDGHAGAIACVAIAADGKTAVSGGDDKTVRVWDMSGSKPAVVLNGHEGNVRGAALSPDGRWALSAGADRTVRLWQVAAGAEVAAFRKHAVPVVAAAFLDNGTQTLSGDRDGNLLPWKVEKFLAATPATPPVVKTVPDAIPPAVP